MFLPDHIYSIPVVFVAVDVTALLQTDNYQTDVAAKAKKPKCLLSHFLSWKVVLLPSVFMLLMWIQHGRHVEDVLDYEGWRL